jgi:hypothetical protein
MPRNIRVPVRHVNIKPKQKRPKTVKVPSSKSSKAVPTTAVTSVALDDESPPALNIFDEQV